MTLSAPTVSEPSSTSDAAPWWIRLFLQEDLNFLVTNRIPRRLATHLAGWLSRVEQPLVRDAALTAWRRFGGLDLSDAARTTFKSVNDCFTRELKEGARPIAADPAVVVSPCDAIVGASGVIHGDELIQAKGFPYSLGDLLVDPMLIEHYRDGRYVTLRLSATMYHRFHAPHDCRVEQVTYVSGDTWNTNPIAIKRVEKLFCKNERAVLRTRLAQSGQLITLVPVASILVASIRLHFLDVLLHLEYGGPSVMACDAPYRKGEEMGWFELGSTILVFAPRGVELCAGIREGQRIRMGEPLLRLHEGTQ